MPRRPKTLSLDQLTDELRRDRRRTRPEWALLAAWLDGKTADLLAERNGVSVDEIGKRVQAALAARAWHDRRPSPNHVAQGIGKALGTPMQAFPDPNGIP